MIEGFLGPEMVVKCAQVGICFLGNIPNRNTVEALFRKELSGGFNKFWPWSFPNPLVFPYPNPPLVGFSSFFFKLIPASLRMRPSRNGPNVQ